jgi:hypothetical protein
MGLHALWVEKFAEESSNRAYVFAATHETQESLLCDDLITPIVNVSRQDKDRDCGEKNKAYMMKRYSRRRMSASRSRRELDGDTYGSVVVDL